MAEKSAGDSSAKEARKTFFLHEHASKLLKSLNETRNRPNMCDVTVAIRDIKIPVQKNVLSAASHYFRALFDYDDKITKKGNMAVISLDNMGIAEETFRSILDFIYTAEVELNPANIQDMLQAADQLLMADLKDVCCEYLDLCITVHNCIGIYDFTSQLSCSWSHLKVSNFLDQHFEEVSHVEEFLRLDAQRVEHFLSRKTIEVKQEDNILDAVLNWYHYDEKNRLSDTLNVLKNVLFAKQITEDSLQRLRNMSKKVGEEIAQVIMELKDEQKELPTVCRGFTRVIIACGGEGSTGKDDSEIKDYMHCVPVSKSLRNQISVWLNLAPMSTPRSGHGLVEVGGYLYAAGGRDRNCRILNSCEKYDPSTNCWTLVAPMNHARVGFGFVAIESHIYAIGGSNDMTDPLMSMEVYDVFTNKWKALPDMVMKRVWACYVAAGKKIYVLGGGIVGKFYESVEVFDTRSLTWYAVSPMRERRCDARAVAVGNDIYVFGGFRRFECPSAAHSGHSLKLCGTEFYSEKNDYWIPIQSRHSAPGLCTHGENSHVCAALYEGDDVLVVGELDMNGEYHTVRSFNRHSQSWECVVINPPPLQTRYACCLLSIPSRMLTQLQEKQAATKSDKQN